MGRNKIILILVFIIIASCNDSTLQKQLRAQSSRLDSLSMQNEKLKREVKNLQNQSNEVHTNSSFSARYVYVLITYLQEAYVPEKYVYPEPDSNETLHPFLPREPIKIPGHYVYYGKLWFTSINYYNNFDEDIKYEVMDRAEDEFAMLHNRESISDKNCYDYETYAEASKDLQYKRDSIERAYTETNSDIGSE